MKLIDMTCPHCGAMLKIDADEKEAVCEHCGTRILIDYEVHHVQYDNAEEAGYDFEKGRQRAIAEAKSQASRQNQKKTEKKGSLLLVLSWIFIFPLPLTSLIMENREMEKSAKYAVIILAWILYLFIGFAYRKSQ